MFTDGACRGNPGAGGWGAVLRYGENEREIHGGASQSTNNRMELTAIIMALKELKRPCRVRITTDSQYVLKGINEWLPNWKKRNWKTANRKPVLNQDLWRELDRLAGGHEITWQWVRGHSGHPQNERADRLANRGIDELRGRC